MASIGGLKASLGINVAQAAIKNEVAKVAQEIRSEVAAVEAAVDKRLNVFKGRLQSFKYIFRSGKEACFINGTYRTDVPSEIAELQNEVAQSHPHIYVDANEVTVSASNPDPIQAIKDAAVAEYLAKQGAVRDMGQSLTDEQLKAKLNTATSADVASGMAGSASSGSAPGVGTL